ncbi:MAG: arylamine N-acetyltransferase [Actinobacteria bacterium]|nr:arylamine N-acetyltransferase [Actinomycetota bacterium]
MFSAAAYLRRLDLPSQVGPPSLDLLAALQLAHLIHVPFENLHVYHHRGPLTDADGSVHKIVDLERGGWCFEVNGAFATLLRGLGFVVDHVSCQVWEGDEGWGPEFDHLATIVHLDGERFFVDVGFGDCCLEPLVVGTTERDAVPRAVRTEVTGDHMVLTELMPSDNGAEWEPQLRISFRPRHLEEFDSRSTHLQISPGLSWHEKPFATRALDGAGSRVILRGDLLRQRVGRSAFIDTPVAAADWSATLLAHFGLVDDLRR